MRDLRILLLRLLLDILDRHVVAIWSSNSTPQDNFGRIFMVLRLSTFVHGTEWTQETTSSLMSVVIWPSQQVSLYSSLQHSQCESPLTFLLRVCWFHSQFEPQNKSCHQKRIRFRFQHRNILDDKQTITSRTGPIFVFPRIHPFTWDDWSLRGRVYSRHDLSICHVDRHQVSCSTVLFQQSSRDQNWIRV